MATQASSTASTSSASASLSAPTSQTLVQAAKLAMEQDRAIMLDYYVDTAQGKAFLGEDGATKDSLLSAADAAMYVAKHTRQQTTD